MSATFKDQSGREWTLQLDAPLIKRIKDQLKIGLTDLRQDPFVELSVNPVLLVDTLWLICEKQAKAAGITDEQFGEGIGDRIDEAAAALEAAVTNFFPTSRRLLLASLRQTNLTNANKEMEAAIARMADPTNQNKMTEAAAKATDMQLEKNLTKALQDLESTDSAPSAANESAT